jgi:hypothetical protein
MSVVERIGAVMSLDRKLNLALREIERSDMLNESRYTEDEILNIITNDSGQIEKLLRDKEYSQIIEKLREGGLV